MSQLELVLTGAAIGLAFVAAVGAGVVVGHALHRWWHRRAEARRRRSVQHMLNVLDAEREHLKAASSWPPKPPRR